MSLIDVKHQSHAQETLQRAIVGDRVHHAYIFHGPDGVGKEMAAQGLARVLLCSEPSERQLDDAEARIVGVDRLRAECGSCDECRATSAESHPDLHLIYRQLNREHPDSDVRRRKALGLGVDVLRHFVIDRVGLTPTRGRAKVFIIREADRISPSAQNALLKTLEEPPEATVLLLLVNALDRLLPTTLSRCQIVRFDPLPTEFVRGKLVELLPDMPSEQIDWYARCSDGSLGLALERAHDRWCELNDHLVEGLGKLNGKSISHTVKVWTDASKALGTGYRKRDPDISETEAARRGFKAIFQLVANYFADVLRTTAADPSAVVNKTWHSQIEETATRVEVAGAADAISRVTQAQRQLDLNANAQLVIETLLNDIANQTSKRLRTRRGGA